MAQPIDAEPTDTETPASEAVNGDIDVLDYLEDIEPAPAGDDPKRDRLD